jgi:uncharacterized membrane protein
MAGIAAESLIYNTVEGGTDDRNKLRQVLAQLRLPMNEIQQKERSAIVQAKALLKDHWATYEALAGAITQHASVTDCSRLIDTANKEVAG